MRTQRSRRRRPPTRADRWVACAAGGTGPRRSPLRTVPFRSGLPRRGLANRAAPGAARPGPGARRRPRPSTPDPSSAARLRRKRSQARARRRAPGRWAPSVPTSPAPALRSRWMIRPATGRAPGRSRPWKPVPARCPRPGPPLPARRRTGWHRSGLLRTSWLRTGWHRSGLLRTGRLRTGPPRRRILTGGAGNDVRPARPRRTRRLTGVPAGRSLTTGAPAGRSLTRDSRPSERTGQLARRGQAAGPGGAGRAG